MRQRRTCFNVTIHNEYITVMISIHQTTQQHMYNAKISGHAKKHCRKTLIVGNLNILLSI